MINWLIENIGTGAFNRVSKINLHDDTVIIDVRDLVDKSGNDTSYIQFKIDECLIQLKQDKKIVICCDYGMSRSNSIAVGVIVKSLNLDFEQAVNIVKSKVDESGIKIEMLDTVYHALYKKDKIANAFKKILITGGNGFLGKGLTKVLSKEFKTVTPTSKEIDLINDSISLDLLVKSEQIDSIIHLANPKIFTTNKSIGDTLIMLKNVLDICRINKTRLIFLSGWEVYSGYKSTGLLSNESLYANPKGTYGETKWLCELLIKQYAINYGIKYQIIRSGPVYGVDGEKPKFIYNFIDKALKNADIITHKYLNGFPSLDLLYIDDLINLIVKAYKSDFTGEVNVGSGFCYSTYEIAQLVCELLNSKSTIKHVNIEENAPNIIMDAAVAVNIFDWKPTIRIREGMNLLITNYKKNG